jgi:2-oxoisovalerate dehydrogenase E1 component
MSRIEPLSTDTPWIRLRVGEDDWRGEDPARLVGMLEQILTIRHFEQKLLELHQEGVVHGPVHASIGQEGAAVGMMSTLATGDKINGTHRMHHQFLAKALNHVAPSGRDPRRADFTEQMNDVIYRTMAEILGLSPGYMGGRGGSMHLKWNECGVLGSNAIVGGNPPHAVGYAFAEKLRGTDNIAVTFFGDGALQNGASYEAMNLAALYDLPIIFFCENNLYAVSTHVREQTRETRLSMRGIGLGVPGVEVDGMDPVAVRAAGEWARGRIREHNGPVLIEALTYRFLHQSGPLRGSNLLYRSKDEEAEWLGRDPAVTLPKKLISLQLLTNGQVEAIDARARKAVDSAASKLTEIGADTNRRRIIPATWPAKETVEYGIRGDLSELANKRVLEVEQAAANAVKEMKFVDAISFVTLSNMRRDDRIFVIGEDVHHLRGGTAGATRGILEEFPTRLVGAPIEENGFTGLAIGAALNGMRPIVEIMYPDFCLVAADQMFNQAAKVRHMFGGNFPLPLVVRSRVSAGTGYGSQHSMDAAGLFALYPGWRIVTPSTPFDYVGLMNAAISCNDPVLVVEYQELFQNTGPVPEDWDYIVPFGKAKTAKTGSDCTVLTYGPLVRKSIDAAAEVGIDAEVIDLRTLDPYGLDWDAIGESVERTGRVVVAEQTTRGTSMGAHYIKGIQERFIDWLDHEIVHVSGTHSSPVVSKVLEQAALAGQAEIASGLRKVMEGAR